MVKAKFVFMTSIKSDEDKQRYGLEKFLHHEFLERRVYVKDYSALVDRMKSEWEKNRKLREDVRKYFKRWAPKTKFVTVGMGIGTSYVNVGRHTESIYIYDDKAILSRDYYRVK